MTTVVHVTFSDDAEAEHFAKMLTEPDGVKICPDADDKGWEELWPNPQSITEVETERETS